MRDTDDQFEQWLARNEVEPLSPPPGTFDRIHRSARRTRWARSAGVAVGVLAVVAGVQVVIRSVATTGPTQVAGATTTGAATTPGGSGTPGGAGTPGAAAGASSGGVSPRGSAGSAQAPGGGTGRCRTTQLRAVVEPSDSDTGHIGLSLRFSNTSARPCTLTGYPGVSFVDGSGRQVNDPARRAAGARSVTVTLAPAGSARAGLRLAEVGTYPAETCAPVPVTGFRIYPPDETEPVVVTSTQQACATAGVGVPEIYPVQPG